MKQYGKRRKRKKGRLCGSLGILLAAAMLFNTLFGGGLSVHALEVDEGTPDLELFGQKVSSGDSGDGWSYVDGVLTLENFHSDNSSGNFIHITNAPLEFTIYVKGENSVKTSGILFYGNVRGSTTITGDQGASLSLEGKNWNDKDIFVRGVNVNVTTQGMIFLSHNMVIDNATVNFNMNGSNGYIYNTHGGFTIENGSEVNIINSSGNVDYCVATNKTEINDSTLNITNPSGFGVYVTAISQEVTEYKAFITNSTISADVLDAGIHCEDEVSVTNSHVTNSGQFLIRSKERINVDNSSTMEGITYEFFKSAMGASYQVYGTHALAADLTVAADGSFVIPEGAALTIPNGVILANNGMMHIHEKASLTGTGVLTGNGTFLIDVNKDMISIPEDLTYTGKNYTDQIMLEREIPICGVEFTADTRGWTRNIEPAVVKDVGDYTVTFTNGDRTISRDFKVVECPHTGLVYKPLAGGGHGGTCPLCSEEISEEHKWVDGVCSLCNVKAVAMLEKNGEVLSYYDESSLDSAFRMAKNFETLKLLGDVTATHKIQSESVVTLDLNGHTYNATQIGDSAFQISYNIIMVKDSVGGGKVTAAAGYACFDLEGGTMSFYGGTFSGGKCAVNVTGTCSLNLHGGTFNGSENAIKHTDNIKTALANHNAFYQDGSPYEPSGKSLPAGTFIVQKCKHEGVKPTSNNDGTHSLTCPYCGYTGTAESCVYSGEYTYDTTNHTQTCTVCGYQKVEAHTIALSAEANGNTVTLSEGCAACDYGPVVGAVNFTFPKVVYGETGTVLTGDRTVPEQYAMFLQMDDGAIIQGESQTVSLSAADLFGSKTMAVGEHKLKVSFANDASEYSNVCELPFTVERAPLTDSMVTLDKTDVTYNGTEQKPTLTVKQGKTRLTLGTDYEVRYTRDGIATTDFTSAGTVTITIKGKGNYTGEVEKTFTIEQAAPDVGTVTAEALENTLDVTKVELSCTNQTTAGTLTLTDSALKYGTNTYTWKFTPDDTVNYKTVTGEVDITVNDTIPPNAEYRIDTDGWKKFINTISFGVFGKDYKTVEIRGTDDTDTVTGSGIKRTEYYISDKEITDTDSIVWNTYTKPVSLNAQGAYFIYVKVTDNAGNAAVLNSEGIVVYAESTVSPAAFDYTYKENRDCTVQIALNGNTCKGLTDKEGNSVDTNHYTIDSDGTLILKAAYLDTLDRGEYTYKVAMNPQGIETGQVTLAYTFTVNVKAKELTVTGATATDRAYDGTKMVEITAVKLSGAAPDDDVAVALKNGIQGTLNSVNAGTYTAVTLPELTLTGADSGNYSLAQPAAAVSTSVTVTPLDAEITVGTDTYNKTFGDAAFTLDVTDNNTEAEVQYEVTKGADVISVENGTVTLRGAGEAEITVSLPKSANYNAAENKTITVTVKKKSGYSVAALNRNYCYQDGGTDSIELAALLPADSGNVTYGEPVVSGDVTYRAEPAMSGGRLSYTLDSGNVNDEGTITVTVATQNYEDITVTVNVKLTDQIPVSLKTGTEVTLKNNVLTYGEPLSELVFNGAEFVGTDGKTVAGTLVWKEAAATPNAGTVSAVWVFTPEEHKYASLEGTAAITVNKAVPTVPAAPKVADRVYNPSVILKGGDLTSVTVTGVNGITLEGTWNWQGADIVPTVNNSGYEAVFTPKDTTNYETVSRTIMVNVTKATPYIAKAPTAAEITYGETLNDSALSGGTVQYGNGAGQAGNGDGNTTAVTGTFTWKEPAAKPVVADSGVTEYTVVFMPSDTANYNSVEGKVKLTVNKAHNVPNMPNSSMSVRNSLEKAGDKEPAYMEDVAKNSAKLDSGISVKWKGNALALKWAKIAGAGGYDIYAAQCGKKRNKKSPAKTVKNGKTSASITKIAGKKISGKKAYSVKIKAWKYVNGKKVYTGGSRTYHIAGKGNKKYTNAKKLKPKKKKYTLKKGRSIRVQVTIVKQSKKKKLLPVSHGPALKYWSGNKKIATVTKEGKVKAKKKGTCYIYVTALNGVREKIKITVK